MEIPIIKTDNAYKGLLEREAAVGMAAHFKDAHDLLNELVDYGTNLSPTTGFRVIRNQQLSL